MEEVGKLGRNEYTFIVDQDHQWWMIAVDQTSKFKAI